MDARLLLVVAGMAGVAALQGPLGESNAERRRMAFRYTPDPALVQVVAGEHRSSVADLLWLRALPDMSREFHDTELKERWLWSVLDAVTELEPDWYTPYSYGASYLTVLDQDAESAIRLLRKGVAHDPDNSRLQRDLGMIYLTQLKDEERAWHHLELAAASPNCDLLTKRMVSAHKAEQGDDLVALTYWLLLMEDERAGVVAAAERPFEQTKRQIVGRVLREYEERHGERPTSREQLRDSGLLLPEVAAIVLPSVEFDAEGEPRYPRLEWLAVRSAARNAADYVTVYREETGATPDAETFWKSWGAPGKPAPAGHEWRYADGVLELDPPFPEPPRPAITVE